MLALESLCLTVVIGGVLILRMRLNPFYFCNTVGFVISQFGLRQIQQFGLSQIARSPLKIQNDEEEEPKHIPTPTIWYLKQPRSSQNLY